MPKTPTSNWTREGRVKLLTPFMASTEGRTKIYRSCAAALTLRLNLGQWTKNRSVWDAYIQLPESHNKPPSLDEQIALGLVVMAYDQKDFEFLPEPEFWDRVTETAKGSNLSVLEALDWLMALSITPSDRPHPLFRKIPAAA